MSENAKTFYTRIKQKRGTAEYWEEQNQFIPLEGEIIVYTASETDPQKIKIGDGEKTVAQLPFITSNIVEIDDKGGSAITGASFDLANGKIILNKDLPNAGDNTLGVVKSGGVATINNGEITAISNAEKVNHILTIQGNGTTASSFDGSVEKTVNIKGAGSTTVAGNANGTITVTGPDALKNPNALKIGTKSYDGSSAIEITASDLGLSAAMKFLGTSATAITDGAATNPIIVGGNSVTVESGNVVLYGSKEFVWNGTAWEELGNEGSYKITQAAVSSPSASGSTTAFIDTISQDTNGKITVTKKNVTVATTDTSGLMSAADKIALDKAVEDISSLENDKVDKIEGKGLSTNDYTTAEKNKLSGIATGAEVNQNAFGNVIIGSTTITADSKTDSLTLVAGTNVTLTPDATNDKITISATDTDTTYSAGTGLTMNGTTINHSNSITAKTTYNQSTNSPGYSGTFKITEPEYDAQGHITGTQVATITMPDAQTIPTALKNPNALTVGSKIYDGSSAVTINASDLGLSNALHFIGTVTSLPSSGTNGDVVLMGSKEYVYSDGWVELGDGDSHALKTVQVKAGDGLTGGGTISGDVTLSHADTSSVSNVTAGERKYVTGLTFDTYGHVTGVTTGTETVTNTDTNTTYDLAASANSTNGNVKLNLTAGGSGSGTDSVTIKGTGTTTVTTDTDGVITINSSQSAISANEVTAGTFAGQVVANSSAQTPGTSLLRNSKLVTAETNPSYNGEICWVYE